MKNLFAKPAPTGQILVLGATGKTGARIVQRLKEKNLPVRPGSRSAAIPFDWNEPKTWPAALDGVRSVYLAYAPDLAIPGARESIEAFVDMAVFSGVYRIVLLSGRGEEEAERSEAIVRERAPEWTIVRSSWFAQNFSEGAFVQMVRDGTVALPAGDVPEPFIDIEDIADVAVAALTEDGHAGEIYEVTGPRLLTFADAVAEIAAASGRPVRYVQIPQEDFMAGVAQAGMPEDIAWLLDYLFASVLDGRNAHLNDGVERALGRVPRDFSDYARRIAASGVWSEAA